MKNKNFVAYERTGYPESTYQTGNTVRLMAKFLDWEDADVAPELVKLVLYTTTFDKLEEFSVTDTLPDGAYYYDLQHHEARSLIYEWYGEIGGTPSLQRGRLTFKNL